MTPEVKACFQEIMAICPPNTWDRWADYSVFDIHEAFTMTAKYFIEDAQIGGLPNNQEFQLVGRISQTLYVMRQMRILMKLPAAH